METPVIREERWEDKALCRGDYVLFIAPTGELPEDREVREAAAKRICATCIVREECLEHALRKKEPAGVWGGLTETERNRMLR